MQWSHAGVLWNSAIENVSFFSLNELQKNDLNFAIIFWNPPQPPLTSHLLKMIQQLLFSPKKLLFSPKKVMQR